MAFQCSSSAEVSSRHRRLPAAPLPPRVVSWTSREDLINIILHIRETPLEETPLDTDPFVITDLHPHDFDELMAWREARDYKNPRFKILFYDRSTSQGIIRVPLPPHEDASEYFRMKFLWAQADAMGDLGSSTIRISGSPRSTSQDGQLSAEPDGAIMPTSRLTQRHLMPSVMVEVGWSQTFPSMATVMNKWFEKSNGQVKIVILIKVFKRKSNHEIVFEKWRKPSQDAFKACDNVVRIRLRDGATPVGPVAGEYEISDFEVTGHLPMVLEFDLVCDRAPRAPTERDFSFGPQLFQQLARHVWPQIEYQSRY